MPAELQAYTGHVWVVGGRAVRVPPPGALAETAPKHAPRTREDDTFFILVTPAAGTHAPASFFEGLARLSADVYFGISGGITGGLREALAAINEHLIAARDSKYVHALAMVQRGDELYVARSGHIFGLLRQNDELVSFPADRRDSLVMNVPPLGVGVPDVQLGRYTLTPGAIMLLADASLIETDDSVLSAALGGDGIRAALEQLKSLAGPELSASVVRFVSPATPDPDGTIPPANRRPPISRPSTMRDVSTMRDAPTPREAVSRETPPPGAPPGAPGGAPEPAPASPEAAPVAPFTLDEATAPDTGAPPDNPAAPEPAPPVGPFVPEEAAQLAPDAGPAGSPLRAGLRGALARASGVGETLKRLPGIPSGEPDAPPDVPARRSPSALDRAWIRVQRWGRDALRLLLTGLLAITTFLSDTLDRILPAPDEEGKQGIPTNVAIGLAVLIPVVIVVVVVGLLLSGYDKSDFETYLERAESAHQEAMSLSNGKCDNQALRPMWSEVLRLTDQARRYRPNDPDVLVIRADAQNYLDCFDDVERRDLTLLHEFSKDAQLVGPVVHSDVDLYTLDRTAGAVYHDTLNETGDGLSTRDNSPIFWRGQTISSAAGNYTVGDLFDIEWLRSGGTAHDNVLIALDRSGVLVSYSPTFFATAQQLVIEGRWQNPLALAVFRQNIYVLDIGANQVWRYVPPAGERRYSNAPEEFFIGDELPDLSTAVDFGISDNGAVYVLFADGVVRQYRRNIQGIVEEQPFNYRDRPPGAITSGNALFVDNDPASLQLYILDGDNQTIYETLLAGTYQKGYRPRNAPNAFDDLTGFYAGPVVSNNMYVLSGNKLYHFKRNP